jgi:hypothetical protein
VFVLAFSTLLQFFSEQVILVLGVSLFPLQYAAAAYWEKSSRLSKTAGETAKAISRQYFSFVCQSFPQYDGTIPLTVFPEFQRRRSTQTAQRKHSK